MSIVNLVESYDVTSSLCNGYDVAQLVLSSIIFRSHLLSHGATVTSAGVVCDSMDHGLDGYLS